MPIKNTSVSFNAVLADLTAYVKSKSDYNGSWKDFYASGAGTTLLEVIAGLGAYEYFAIESARRDTFLQECRLRSSAVAIAQNVGYSAFRGSNPKFTVTITPTATSSIPQYTQVGTYKSWPILTLNPTTLNANIQTSFDVVIGLLTTDIINIPSASLQPFRFIAPNVSEDVSLDLNGTLLPTSRAITDLIKDQWVTISNPQGALDAFYNNSDTTIPRAFNYATADVLTLTYVQLDATMGVIDTTKLLLTVGQLLNTVTLSAFQPPETLESIRVNAPYHADVQHVVRSRDDFFKFFATTVPNISSTASLDDPQRPYEHFISYLRTDFTLLTAAEKAQFLTDLEIRRPMGVMPATILDPISVPSTMSVVIHLNTGATVAAGTASTDVTTILRPYLNQLGIDLTNITTLSIMENALETGLSYARTVRMTSSMPTTLRWNEYTQPVNTITLV